MKLKLVGIGTCVPQLGVFGSCALMSTEGGDWLVDVGTGAMQGLMALGHDPRELDGVFLTHHHPDHSGELPALIQTIVWGSTSVRKEDFLLAGGPGTSELVASWARFYGHWVYGRNFRVNVLELADRAEHCIEGLAVRTARSRHTESSVAFRFEDGSRSLVVTGDTGPCPELEELAFRADVLCIECSFPDDQPRSGHMTPSEVGRMAAAAEVGTVVLTHMYPECDPDDARKAVEKRFGGKVVTAAHGLEVQV